MPSEDVLPQTEDRNRFRLTPQRLAVLEAVRSSRDHPDAGRIYEMTRQKLPRISLGTVYRTLGKLRDKGYLRELPRASGPVRYDANPDGHFHVNCTRCGSIVDVEMSQMAALQEQAKSASGFPYMFEGRIEFFGVCLSCFI